jgi:hypothetical protein
LGYGIGSGPGADGGTGSPAFKFVLVLMALLLFLPAIVLRGMRPLHWVIVATMIKASMTAYSTAVPAFTFVLIFIVLLLSESIGQAVCHSFQVRLDGREA